jgi:hypothetical protein
LRAGETGEQHEETKYTSHEAIVYRKVNLLIPR